MKMRRPRYESSSQRAAAAATAAPLLLLGALLLLLLLTAGPSAAATETCPTPPAIDYYQEELDQLGGNIVTPKALLNMTVWKGDATLPNFTFPELSDGPFGIPALQSKPNFGIGVSGGGLRATSLALGWLRGMKQLDLLNKARYLGSASGGSFASTMISYSDPQKLTQLLGPYFPPEYASLKNITNLGKGLTFGGALATASPTFYQVFIEALRYNTTASTTLPNSESGFSRAISVFLMNRLGLGLWNSTTTITGTRGAINVQTKTMARKMGLKVYEALGSAPFPIMTGNILDYNEPMYFYPFEMTPLYTGSPCNFSRYTTREPKGGGLVEAMGFNSVVETVPELEIGKQGTISLNSTFVQPLVGKIGVSGGIMAVELRNTLTAQPVQPGSPSSSSYAGQPYYNMWNFEDYNTTRYPFGDGGYTDNQGLVAMLRRKVKKILLFYAIANPINDKAVWSMANSGLSQPFGRCQNCYTYLSTNITDELINNASRVFQQQGEFDRLFDEYQANVCKGTINVFNATLDVIDNPFLGVQGGWKVELMIVMNSVIKDWEDKLPADTKANLNSSRTNKKWLAKAKVQNLETTQLVDFPFFDIFTFKYDQLSVGALMNMATWTVLQLEQKIRDFIGA